MNQLKQKYKQLFKYYDKELNKCHKINFNAGAPNLDYFVTYLRYLRDSYLLTLNINLKDPKIISLCQAIGEYEEYSTCINKYYKLSNKMIESIDKEKSKEEIQKAYQIEKTTHWNIFWSLVCNYMESWTADEFTL